MILPPHIARKIAMEPGCWRWMAAVDDKGYGRVGFEGAVRLAHRVVYALFRGPIPDGFTLDHLCRNRACVNPAHLEPVTSRENTVRGMGPTAINTRKTQCPRGHTDYVARTSEPGKRKCRTCRAADTRRWRYRVTASSPSNFRVTP